jgi:hypothetical protein
MQDVWAAAKKALGVGQEVSKVDYRSRCELLGLGEMSRVRLAMA